MNGRDLYRSIYSGEPTERLPVQRMSYWEETKERWRKEGWNGEGDPNNDLNLGSGDAMGLPLNLSFVPLFPIEVLEDDGYSVVLKDEFGVTKRMLHADFHRSSGQMVSAGTTSSMSQWLDFPVKDLFSWKEIFEDRLRPTVSGRLPENWENQKSEFIADSQTRWVVHYSFPLMGLFGPIRELMGYEQMVFAMKDRPQLIHTIVNDLTDFWLNIYAQVLGEVRVDEIIFFEDMCSSRAPLLSPSAFQHFFSPGYMKTVGGLREMGVSHFFVDSDGDLRQLIPELLRCGITGTHPCEVNSGMDPKHLRERFPSFCLNGGIDKRALTRGQADIDEELTHCFGVAWTQGRYTPTIDHGVPPDVSWENMNYFARRYREFCEAPAQHTNASITVGCL